MYTALMDVKDAYMRSGSIRWDNFVKAQKQLHLWQDTVWEFSKLPYGIVKAERQ